MIPDPTTPAETDNARASNKGAAYKAQRDERQTKNLARQARQRQARKTGRIKQCMLPIPDLQLILELVDQSSVTPTPKQKAAINLAKRRAEIWNNVSQ